MTRPDLEAIRARCEAATPGPWKVQDHDGWYWSVVKADEEDDGWMPDVVFDDGTAAGEYGTKCKPHDRDFLVAARTDIPALLAYVEELESRTTYTIGETEWASRIAHAEQRFVDEYDLRKAAEKRIEKLTEERDEERMRTRCFEQAMAEAETDLQELRARVAELEARRWNP